MPTTLDVGGLRFLSSDPLQSAAGEYFVNTGTVSIGYTPVGSENFLPLVQAKLLASGGSSHNAFTLMPNQTTPSFEIAHTELDLVVVAGSPSIPLPIWKSTDPDFTETFALGELKTTGVLLDEGRSEAITVADVDFTLNTLLFHNPDSGTTANAQVKMQGDASFDKVPLVKDFGITAHVGGPNDLQNNFVIADHAGITLTGLDVTKDLPSNLKVAGLAVSGTVTIGYSHADNSFSFGGTVHLTSEDQGSGNVALNNVAATLEVTVAGGHLGTFGFGISTGFHIFDLNVSTTNEHPLLFKYNAVKDQFEISGGLQLEFNFNTISATLDDGMGGPGILIENGQLTQFHAIFNADITLFGATIEATNLTFDYSATKSQFEMYGDLSLTIPTENQVATKITAHLGTQADPGLVLQNGTLTQINMGLGGSFDVFGFHVTAAGANLEWQKADNTFLISGAFMADFRVFQVLVTLGNSPTTGLIIKDGHFQLKDAKFELDNATLGPVTLKQLLVEWQEQGTDDFNIDVGGKVVLPGGWEVDAALVFDLEGLESIGVSAKLGEGIPIGDTGLFITELGGSIKNLENPSQIIVSAHLGVTWGETFTLFGHEVKLFRAEGDITVDANELVLSGSVQLGAYSTDGGTTWQAAAGSGDAKLTLDWGDQLYSLHMDVKGMFVIFDLSGDLTFNAGKEIKFLAQADVVIPPEVPFIGGDTLGGLGFFFDHVFKHDNVDTSTTLAAWIDIHIIWDVEVGFEYVYNDTYPNGHFALIGAGTIDNFKAEAMPPVDQTYTYQLTPTMGTAPGAVPANATYLTFSADWSKPAAGTKVIGQPKFRVQRTVNRVTQPPIPEDQFAAHGIGLIQDPKFATATTKALQIVGSNTDAYAPLAGEYTLLVDVTAEGGNPFPDFGKAGSFPDDLKIQTTYHIPKPTFGARNAQGPYVPSVPAAPNAAFPLTLTGSMDEGLLTSGKAGVSVYRVLAQDPQQTPELIATATPAQVSGPDWQAVVNVPITGLYPLPYTIYAVVKDGFNVPVKTASSAAFTPAFAVIGSVSNQVHDAKTGWPVFLDYNRNCVHDADEPIYQTSNPDGAFAFTPTFDPSTGWKSVPADGTPFNVQLIVPGPQDFAHVAPVTISYNGTGTQTVPFEVMEKTAITGIVYADLASGHPGQAGWEVFLDANGNGRLDASETSTLTDGSGHYSFHDLTPNSTQTVSLQLPPYYSQTTPRNPGTHRVAVGNTPFTIYDNNDFGVQPFPTISGQVMSEPYANGVLGPLTSPLVGATVILTQGGRQIASTTSGADGSYSFPHVPPGKTYEVGVFKNGWRQINPIDLDAGGYLSKLDVKLPGSGSPAPGSVAVADFNGDGVQDLAVLDSQIATDNPTTTVWIYYNDPKGGGFVKPPVGVAAGGGDVGTLGLPMKVVAGHFSQTGLPELAVLYLDGLVTLLHNVNGTLQPGTPWVNLPGNGNTIYDDLVTGHFFTGSTPLDELAALYYTNTTYVFAPVAFGAGHGPVATTAVAGFGQNLAAGDINGDGITDLFIGNPGVNYAGAVPGVYYGDGTGQFKPTAMSIFPRGDRTVVGDINSDGLLDLAVLDDDGTFSYAIQDNTGAFPSVITSDITTGSPGYGAVLQDVNFDFRPDLVWVTSYAPNGSPPLSVFLNTGAANNWFTSSASANLPLAATTIYALAVASLEGPNLAPPGIGDIVVVGNPSGQTGPQFVQVLDRDGINTPPQTVPLPGGQNATGVDFVMVDVDNGARLLAPIADQQVEQGATLSLLAPLTRAATAGRRVVFSLEPGAPPGARIDPVSGQFHWTADAPGRYAVSVRLTDPYQPARTETMTFVITVRAPAAALTVPSASGPLLDGVIVKRSRQPGQRGRLLGATLIFNVPVNLDPHALRLVRHRPGQRGQDLARWIQIVMVVQNGQTWAHLRFRSPRGGLLPKGRYSLTLQNDLLRNALTGASLTGPGSSSLTEIPF